VLNLAVKFIKNYIKELLFHVVQPQLHHEVLEYHSFQGCIIKKLYFLLNIQKFKYPTYKT